MLIKRIKALSLTCMGLTFFQSTLAYSQNLTKLVKETSNEKQIVEFEGNCTLKLYTTLDCQQRVRYVHDRGLSAFILRAGDDKSHQNIIFIGDTDRQESLNDYYLEVQRVEIFYHSGKANKAPTKVQASGTCHMNVNDDGTETRFIRCQASNRQMNIFFSFNLESITATEQILED